LPSSLTEVLPSTLVCSTSPPVSVCGTVAPGLARGFSRQYGINPCGLGRNPRLPVTSQSSSERICLSRLPTGLEGFDTPGPILLRPPIARNGQQRDRNTNLLSITYAFRPRLRPASPAVDQHGCGTLGHSVGRIRTSLALLVPTFSLPSAPGRFPPPLHGGWGRSPTMQVNLHPRLRYQT
jgi:hypothetical protein